MRSVSPGNWDTLSRKTHTTQTHFLHSVSGTQRRGLHTYIHSYCYHRTCHKYTHRDTMPYRQTCHTNITYILATPTTHSDTQNHTCSYILAAPATKKQTRKAKTKQKKQNKNSTKFGATLLWRLFLAHCTHCYWYARFSFLIFGIAAVPSYIHQKNPKLRVQHTWFLEIGFVIVFSQKQDIKNNNGEFAILKMVWCANGHIKLPFLDSRTKTSTSNYIAVMCGYQKLYKKY